MSNQYREVGAGAGVFMCHGRCRIARTRPLRSQPRRKQTCLHIRLPTENCSCKSCWTVPRWRSIRFTPSVSARAAARTCGPARTLAHPRPHALKSTRNTSPADHTSLFPEQRNPHVTVCEGACRLNCMCVSVPPQLPGRRVQRRLQPRHLEGAGRQHRLHDDQPHARHHALGEPRLLLLL